MKTNNLYNSVGDNNTMDNTADGTNDINDSKR